MDLWKYYNINLTGKYLYTFSGDDIYNEPPQEPVNGKLSDDSIIVTVDVPWWRRDAFYLGTFMHELGSIATIMMYIPGCEELAPLSMPFEEAAICNFNVAVNPDFNYTEAVVPPTDCDAYDLIFPTDLITDSAQFRMKSYCDAQNRKQAYQKYNGGLIRGASDVNMTALSLQLYHYQSRYYDDFEGLNRTWGRKAAELESQDLIPTVADVQTAKQDISENGLPQEQIDFLKGNGYTDDDIETYKQNVLDIPDDIIVNYTSIIQIGLWGEEISSWQQLKEINERLGDQAPPLTNYSASVTDGTTPLTVQFTDYSTRNPNQWYWNFGDNQTSPLQNPSHTYTAPGNYTVRLTATNLNGNDTRVKYDLITVNESTAIEAEFTSNVTTGTVPLSIEFTDSSTNNPVAWFWDFGDGGTSTEQNPIHTYISEGIFTVSLNATNSGGSNMTTKTELITATSVSTAPVANFTALPVRAVSFNDTSLNTPTTWLWDFGDGKTSTEQNVTHIYQDPGTYNITLTVGNEFGNNTLTQTNSVTV
jgi:PKD repeat protein